MMIQIAAATVGSLGFAIFLKMRGRQIALAGLGGAVTFKNARRPIEVAAWLPEDRLLIETDAPYMTPAPFRGKRNSSALIPYTAEKIAQVRGMTPEQVLRMTRENAERLFGVVCPA